jgi:hypothetical protein
MARCARSGASAGPGKARESDGCPGPRLLARASRHLRRDGRHRDKGRLCRLPRRCCQPVAAGSILIQLGRYRGSGASRPGYGGGGRAGPAQRRRKRPDHRAGPTRIAHTRRGRGHPGRPAAHPGRPSPAPGRLAAAAAAGHATLEIARQPIAAISPTGNEIQPIGSALRPGDVIDSNSLMLAREPVRSVPAR